MGDQCLRRLLMRLFVSNTISLSTGQIELTYLDREQKCVQMVLSHDQDSRHTNICKGKLPSKILIPRTRRPMTLDFVWSIEDVRPSKVFFSKYDPRSTLTYFTSRSNVRVGSHVVSVRIHCTEIMADFFPHRCFKQK